MQLRKVQEMGGATLLVSLPKDWAKSSSVRKGSVLAIEDSGDGGLLIHLAKPEEDNQDKEILIEYPSKYSPGGIPNEITAAYLLGYDLIRIRGQHRIAQSDRDSIIASMKRLIGLEIVEEDAHGITGQFLVDKTAVEPSKIFRRISALVRSMISDTMRQAAAGDPIQPDYIAQRDDEVDRLHFLLVRLIRSAVREPRIASKFGLNSIDCLDFRVAASSLETAGDYAVELSGAVTKVKPADPKSRKILSTMNELLESIQDSASRSFLSKDFTLSQRTFEEYKKLVAMIAELREGEGKTLPSFLHTLDIIERILHCQRDIADLISPMNPA